MNPMLFNFCLMLFWASIALYMLVLGPLFTPDMVPDKGRGSTLGFAAALLAIWNLVRFWSMRSARRERVQRASYRETRNPKPASNEPKPVLHPEFQFDEMNKPAARPQGGKPV
jgi:hypothetical protein